MTHKHERVHFNPRVSTAAVVHGIHTDLVSLQLPGEVALGDWLATLQHDPVSGELEER